ncbi:MAG: hypothetical protein F4142_00435, partial [Nitrospira sp. SB0675_bin_23]|nr:hypothetical protein [Nitrospira sp. SB0675_bin_23]
MFDVDEPPSAPAVTAVNPTPGSATSLDASWTAPDNTGKPAITSYDLRYRAGSSGAWTGGPQDVPGTSSQIAGLDSGTAYQVQVRATNDEGDGNWSNAASGMTSCPSATAVAAFASAASSAREDAGTRNVRVNLSPAPQAPVTLNYTVGGTAGSGDFSIAGSGSVRAAANASSVDIPVAITDDSAVEGSETVILTLTGRTGCTDYTVGTRNVHTLTINDNDGFQEVSIAAGAGPVTEGSDAEFELTRTGLALSPLTVRLSVAESSTGGGDFVASSDEGDQEVVFPAGSHSVTWAVPIQDDGADEPDGGVRVTVRNGTGYVRHNSNHSASLAIADDDATEVRLSGSSDDIAENGGTKVLTVATDRTLVAPEALSVPLVFSDEARRGTDYTVACGTADGVTCHNLDADRPRIDFTGPSARRVTLTLTAIDDGIDEGLGERVSVGFGTLDATSGTNLAGGATGIGTSAFRIDDDDTTALTVSPVLSGAEFWEGDTLDVTVSGIPSDYAAVTLATTGSTAVRGTDYRLLRSGGATLGASDTLAPSGGSVTFKVQALADGATEGDETVVLRLDDPGGTLDTTLGTLTLTDGARPVLPAAGATVSKTALTLVEGGPSGRYTVALTRAPGTGETVTVTAASGDSGAVQVAGPGGAPGASVALSFTAADWNVPKTVAAHAQEDADGMNETVTVTHAVAGPGDWQGASAASVVVKVADDESPVPAVSIAGGQAVTEGGMARFTLTANPAPLRWLGVLVQVTQDGAFVSPHQAQLGRRFVRFRPGASSATLMVRTEDDRMGEADGAVRAQVMRQGSAYDPAPQAARASVAVTDNDGGAVTLSVADVTANESGGSMNFTATLSKAVGHPVLFRVRTRETDPVSAREGDDYFHHDYRALDREIRIWPGRTSATFWVRIWNDSHDEDDERFEVVLSEVRGADVGDGVAVGTIQNNDPMPAAWLSRFGRTVAQQALDGIAGRLAAARTPGVGVRASSAAGGLPGNGMLAGLARAFGTMNATDPLSGFGDPGSGRGQAFGDGTPDFGNDGFTNDRGQQQPLTVQDVLLGSSFTVTGKPDGTGGSLAFWGRA